MSRVVFQSWPDSGETRGASRRGAAKTRQQPRHTPLQQPRHAPPHKPRHAPRHVPRMPFALLVTALIVGGLALLLLLNTASAANEVRRHDITARDASIAAEVQELQNEVAASAAPGNLAQAAAALGMVPAQNPAFLVVGSDGSVKVLGSAAPASAVVLPQPTQHSRTPKPTASKTASKTAANSASKTASPTGGRGEHADATKTSDAHPSSPATPTPTPTPTLTLPGGNR